MKATRCKNPTSVKVHVTCSCGAAQTFFVFGCANEACEARWHVKATIRHDVKEGVRLCPALVATLRACDEGISRADAESILVKGLAA